MGLMQEKLTEAIEAKKNDVKSFVWRFAKVKGEDKQRELKLIDATPEQLKEFYKHCNSMLYSTDKLNPGRFTLLETIKEQRSKCNIELFLRGLESGELCKDHRAYPRYLYLQDINGYMNNHKDDFPADKLDDISIAVFSGGLPREYERISVKEVMEGCLKQLGIFNNKHITFSFIINMGIYLTPDEMKEMNVKDSEGNTRNKLEVIKEKLNLKNDIFLAVKPSGLSFKEMRSMLRLHPVCYSMMTTDQLVTLRNKVLFRLEKEVNSHIAQWKEIMRQIELVAKSKGVDLK